MSGHDLTVLDHANEKEFIGQLIKRQQLSLEELLETPAFLALVNIKDSIGIRLELVGLLKSHDQLVEH